MRTLKSPRSVGGHRGVATSNSEDTVGLSKGVETALSVTLTLATLAVALIMVEGRLRPRRASGSVTRVEKIDDWRAKSGSVALRLSDSASSVQIDVFTDFECPFCRILDSVLVKLEHEHDGNISRSVIHFPLPMHKSAMKASQAFDCAARQQKAAAMSDILFKSQQYLGVISIDSLAREVGVPDGERFAACLNDAETLKRIREGSELAERLQLTGTPVVVINGWLLDPASPAAVGRAVKNALAGKTPNS